MEIFLLDLILINICFQRVQWTTNQTGDKPLTEPMMV